MNPKHFFLKYLKKKDQKIAREASRGCTTVKWIHISKTVVAVGLYTCLEAQNVGCPRIASVGFFSLFFFQINDSLRKRITIIPKKRFTFNFKFLKAPNHLF